MKTGAAVQFRIPHRYWFNGADLLKYIVMKYSEIIPHYIDIKDDSQRIVLSENLRLSGKKIAAISVWGLSSTQLPTGKRLIGDNDLRGFYLVLVNRSREILSCVPLSDIAEKEEYGAPLELFGNTVDISSCYIMQPNPDNSLIGFSILLNFCITTNNTDELQGLTDHISVTISPNAGNFARIYFPDQQSFVGRRLLSISTSSGPIKTPDGYMNYLKESPTGEPTVTLIDTTGRMVTDALPISLINSDYPVVGFNRYQFDGQNIDWARSFVELNGTTTTDTQLFFNLSLTKNW